MKDCPQCDGGRERLSPVSCETCHGEGKVPDQSLFYIRDKRQVVGNCALWWCPNGHGYTCNLDEAGLFTEEEARDITRNRDTDVAYRAEEVQKHAIRHVRFDSQLAPEPVKL